VLFCVDVGNTQIALGLYASDAEQPGADDPATVRPPLLRQWRMRTDPRMTADELDVAFTGMLGPLAERVTGLAALSTVPMLLRELRILAERYAERMPTVIVEPRVRTGVPILVDNPKEVGADRVVNTLAAHRLFGTACVIVDFGTSTNIDVVSARGEFLGGAIAPGIEVSAEALTARAAQLTTVELTRPRSAIGKNTVECLQAGILFGFTGQVDGLVRRILVELGASPGTAHGDGRYGDDRDGDNRGGDNRGGDNRDGGLPVTVLATGGLAPLITDESETITEHVPDLTLLGLRLVYLRPSSRGGRTSRAAEVTMGSSTAPSASRSGRASR
jgi:type III pantothenate kinase